MGVLVDPAEQRLRQAAFALREAQQNLEKAERHFAEALHAVDTAEQLTLPTAAEMRGIFKAG